MADLKAPPVPTAPEGEPELHLSPPDEQLWEKYSPHYEMPISGLISVTLHVIGIAVVLAIVFNLFGIFANDPTPPPQIVVDLPGDSDQPKGGGQKGDGNPLQEAVSNPEVTPQQTPQQQMPKVEAPTVTVKPPDTKPEVIDPTKVAEDVPDAASTLQNIASKAASDLERMARAAGSGPAGSGSGSGPGTTSGERNARQHINFGTIDSHEWVRILRLMGATIIVPRRDGEADIFRPTAALGAPPVREKLTLVERKYFQVADQESLQSLQEGLGLRFTPATIFVFLPQTVADEMLQKELSYRNTPEGQIAGTDFLVRASRGGGYTIAVTDQQKKR